MVVPKVEHLKYMLWSAMDIPEVEKSDLSDIKMRCQPGSNDRPQTRQI